MRRCLFFAAALWALGCRAKKSPAGSEARKKRHDVELLEFIRNASAGAASVAAASLVPSARLDASLRVRKVKPSKRPPAAEAPPGAVPAQPEAAQPEVAALRHADQSQWKAKKKEARLAQKAAGTKSLGDAGTTNADFDALGLEVRQGGRLAEVPCSPPHCTFRCRTDAPCRRHPLLDRWTAPQPRECPGGRQIHPISFSIPASEVVSCVPTKGADFATIVPYRMATYVFGPADEAEYKRDYRKAYFGLTRKKEGWDCMRHYEILASGSVPVFLDISDAPAGVMTHLPRELLQHVRRQEAFWVRGCDMRHELGECTFGLDKSKLVAEEYDSVSCSLLEHTRQHLTTRAMAAYMLKAAAVDDSSLASPTFRALFIGGTAHNSDYLRDLAFHGLRELLGPRLFEFNTPRYMYAWASDAASNEAVANPNKLWGMGFSVARRLRYLPEQHLRNQSAALDLIAARYFDLIVYGNVNRGTPMWFAVQKAGYPKDKVIVLNGEDWHGWKQVEDEHADNQILDRATYFMREMPDGCPDVD